MECNFKAYNIERIYQKEFEINSSMVFIDDINLNIIF